MSEIKNGQWMLNQSDNEDWTACLSFDSKEEAVKYGVEMLSKYNSSSLELRETFSLEDDMNIYPDNNVEIIGEFDVGQVLKYAPGIDVELIIERFKEDAYEFGGEYADDYLDDVTKEDKEELEEFLGKWIEKYPPNFYTIENIETIYLVTE